jgi:P4 family phage/plasmid primase-like protien
VSDETSVESRLESSWKFVKELWGKADPNWLVEVDLLQYRPTQDDPGDQRMRGVFYTVEHTLNNWPQVFEELENFNRTQVENIHHGVNPRFRRPKKLGKNPDISHYVAIWIDEDFKDQEAIVRKHFADTVALLKEQNLEPSVVIESGRGLHAYWLFDQPYPTADARPVCAGIQKHFQLSDTINDPRRVLRLPGFINLKEPKDPKWCRITEATWKRYSILDFKDYVVEPTKTQEEKEEEEAEKNKPITYSHDPKIEQAKGGVSQGGGPHGGRHQSAVALAGHWCAKIGPVRKTVLYAMNEWNAKNSPPLPDDEILKVVEDIIEKEKIKRAEDKDAKKGQKTVEELEKEKRRIQLPWIDEDGSFNPSILAQHWVNEFKMLSTPIGRDGRGVDLYVYRNGVYVQEGNSFIRDKTDKILGSVSRDKNIEEVLKLVTQRVKVHYDDVNKNAKNLINVKNGLLDWKTGELKPHDHTTYSLIQIQTEYDPNAKSDVLDKFINQVMPPDCVPLIEEFMGYLLIPDTSFAKCLVAVGEGGNGKSTFLHLIEKMIGTANISHYSLHAISEDKFTASGLVGKLCNFYDELESKVLENTATFKQIVAGDQIKAEEKGKAPFSFKPFSRLVFATNQMPRANDRSQAYFDRILLVRFPNRFRDTDQVILDYDEVLAKTPGLLSALLNRALSGLKRLMKQGRFSKSQSSIDAIDDYQRECNSALDFLQENCTLSDPNGWVSRSDLYDRYKAWSIDSGRKPLSHREFTKSLKAANVREVRHGDGRGWGGVSWLNGRPPDTSSSQVAEFTKTVEREASAQKHLDF